MRLGPFLLLPLALTLAGSLTAPPARRAGPIWGYPLALNPDVRGPLHVGRLRFLAGWTLHSSNLAFGGLSSMVADDAGRFLAVGDRGTVFRFRLRGAGRFDQVDIHDLPGVDPAHPELTDTESVAVDPARGTVWIGYEHLNQIARFDPGATRVTATVRPALMHDWPSNGGPEAMARLADGRFVVFSEDSNHRDGSKDAVLFSADPTQPDTIATPFRYRPPGPGYKPTDARQLPDGRLLVLHRRLGMIDGFSAVLAVVDPAAIRSGALVGGTPVARLAWPLAVDNMEALAVTREHGRTILWIASDDNFLVLERTLLLKFALEE